MKKRLLALCLVICMVLGMLPMTAFAAETNRADFDSIANTSTSFGMTTTTAGWVLNNCAFF